MLKITDNCIRDTCQGLQKGDTDWVLLIGLVSSRASCITRIHIEFIECYTCIDTDLGELIGVRHFLHKYLFSFAVSWNPRMCPRPLNRKYQGKKIFTLMEGYQMLVQKVCNDIVMITIIMIKIIIEYK